MWHNSKSSRFLQTLALATSVAGLGCRPAAAPPTQPAAKPPSRPVVTAAPEEWLAPRLETLTVELDKARIASDVPGLAVAIVHKGGVVFAKGFGKADLEAASDVTPRTIFPIGSSTKAFTSALIAMQVDDGKLGWDDPVERYVPEFSLAVDSKSGARASLRDLLSHRSGFTRMGILWASGKVATNEFLAQASKAEPTEPLGKKFQYNNVAYVAAGEASARVAAVGWHDLLRARILEPLGMADTTSIAKEAREDSRFASGYRWDKETDDYEKLPMRALDHIAPAGAINSNVLDMTRWLRFQLAEGEFEGSRLVSAEALLATREAQIDVRGKVRYGMGWFVDEREGEVIIHHGGNIDGYSSMVGFMPGRELGFVALMNAEVTPLQGAVGELIYKTLLDPPATPADAALDESLEAFTGVYVADFAQFAGKKFTVTKVDGKLFVDVPGQKNFELRPPDTAGHRAFVLTDTVAVSFEGEQEGKSTTLRLHQGGYDFEVFREGYAPDPEVPLAELEPYLGLYEHPKLGKAQVELRNNRLAIDVPDQMTYALDPPDADGKWAFRVKREIGVTFDPPQSPKSFTMHQGGTTYEFVRVQGKGAKALPPLVEVLRNNGISETVAALTKHGVVKVEGKLRFVQAGVTGRFEFYLAADGRSSFSMDAGAYGKLRVDVHGDRGWTLSDFDPFEDLKGQFLEQARWTHLLVWSLDWAASPATAKVVGRAKASGDPSWEVSVQRGDLPRFEVLVEASSGEVREVNYAMLSHSGPMKTTERFFDYRTVEGLRLPHRIERVTAGSGMVRLDVESVSAYTGDIAAAFPPRPPQK